MAHEISIVNGRAEMFSGMNVVPWHKLGTVVSGTLTAAEAIEAAHLSWPVEVCPCYVWDTATSQYKEVDSYYCTKRADTQAGLGVVRGRYEPIQNAEAFSFFDRIVGEGKASYETAGALRGGKQVWIMAKYDGELSINGDAHKQWILLVTSHDGSYALTMQWITERVVCANTLSIALRGATNRISIRHTKGWSNAEQEAKRTLGLTQDYFTAFQGAVKGMNEALLSPEDMRIFNELLLPGKPDESGKVPTRTLNMREEIDNLFGRGDGNKGVSRWDALQAVADYADHRATLRGENSTRLESACLGSAAQLKQRAFDLLTGEELTAQLINARPHVSVAEGLSEFGRLMGQ